MNQKLYICLTLLLLPSLGFAYTFPDVTCAAVAQDGALAAMNLDNGQLTAQLVPLAGPAKVLRVPTTHHFSCAAAFSDDGKWVAILVSTTQLDVTVIDRESWSLHKRFSSPLNVSGHERPVLLGFLDEDDSILLGRTVPSAADEKNFFSEHVQRWSVDGEILSDQRTSIPWSRSRNRSDWPVGWSGAPVAVPTKNLSLSVEGGHKEKQRAVLSNSFQEPTAEVALPFFPNLALPLISYWFVVNSIAISSDGEYAAISRTRIAWVFIDTNRDWGSEIVLLKLNPLQVLSTIRTGQGGIGAVAIDHHAGTARAIAYWRNRWHVLQSSDAKPQDWTNQALPRS